LLLGAQRAEQAILRHLLEDRQRARQVAAVGRRPRIHHGCQEHQVAIVAADLEPRQCMVGAAAPQFVGNQQQARIAGELGRGGRARKPQRELYAAGAKRFAKGLAGDVGLRGCCAGDCRQQLRRARMIPVHRCGASLDIGPGGIESGNPRGGGRGCAGDRGQRHAAQQFTCSGNWALRRLQE
jgi:hypothetical protein